MKRATGAKAASLRAGAGCSIFVCRARRRPGPPGSMPATWRFSKITRWTATSSSRRRASWTSSSKRACSCLKAARSSSRTSKSANRSSCPTRRRACISSFPTTPTSARSRSRAALIKAPRGRCMSSARCAASAPNRPSPPRLGKATAAPGTEPVEVEGFYRYMSDLGLRYGEEFRPIRELSAGARPLGGPRGACPRRSPAAPANTRCIRCSSTARCKPSPPVPRPSRIAVRA